MRSQFIQQNSGFCPQTEDSPAGKPSAGLNKPGADAGWALRNRLASAVLMAVIGLQLCGPSEMTGGSAGPATVQTADWIDDLIEILKGGSGGSGGTGGSGNTNP